MHHDTGCGLYAVEPEQLFGFHSVAAKLQKMWKGNSAAASGPDDVEQQGQSLSSPSAHTIRARPQGFMPSDYANNSYYRGAMTGQYGTGQNQYAPQGYKPSLYSQRSYAYMPDPVPGIRSNGPAGAGIQSACGTYLPYQSQTRRYSGSAAESIFHGASDSFGNQDDTGITSRRHDTVMQPSYLPTQSSAARNAHSLGRDAKTVPSQTSHPYHTVHAYSSPMVGAYMRPGSQSLAENRSAPGDMYKMGR